jgi:hypothetical protein
VRAGLDDRIDRARIGEQEVPSQCFNRIGAAEEGGQLQQGVAEERLVKFRCVDNGAGSLHDRRIAAEVVCVRVRGEHPHNVAANFFADDLERPLGARCVEPGVDEHDLPVVVAEHPNVHRAGQDPDPIGKRYQDSQPCSTSLAPDR